MIAMADGDEAKTRAAWQFQLWHLFTAISVVSGCAAVAHYRGPGSLMTTLGLSVAALNLTGWFASLHTPRRRRILLWIAWVTFLASLGLPAFHVFGIAYGWEAAWIVLVGPWERIANGQSEPHMLLWIADSVANLLLAALPLLIWRLGHGKGEWLSGALLALLVAPWLTSWWSDMNMLAGYYVWCASFYLCLLALPVRKGVFAAMLLTALGLIALIEVRG